MFWKYDTDGDTKNHFVNGLQRQRHWQEDIIKMDVWIAACDNAILDSGLSNRLFVTYWDAMSWSIFTQCRYICISSQHFIFQCNGSLHIKWFLNLTYVLGDFFGSGALSSRYMYKTQWSQHRAV